MEIKLPTQEAQDLKLEELYEKYKSVNKLMIWKISKEYTKWYVEKIIDVCADVAEIEEKWDNPYNPSMGITYIVDKQSILNVKKKL